MSADNNSHFGTDEQLKDWLDDARKKFRVFEASLLEQILYLRAEIERWKDRYDSLLRAAGADIKAREAEIERLKRGEFICSKCGLRKDGEGERGDF